MEGREVASEEGTSSPYVPPQNQEVTSYLHLQNSRRKASLTSRRGGVSKSEGKQVSPTRKNTRLSFFFRVRK